ncbi:copper chaperone PCu(A)C [Streptomyces neyagawaensis]|uniref:copper chaperone PCu(A)C n=1 Tax=Streptomyces neyagawaensis TaxID=42238 RepID=UPI0006E1E86C|nr:copper chaperone PCu(A)C [Streptomyces neyagawaensis]MCL6736920.1 copper chaperone PCu(A)C [Streptomyces neyagawaensis]MDE1687256.1 copper chaperone PCu(A)C [Streptomyces neyagawaensis]
MSSSLRRGTLAAAALAFSIASLAACSAGSNAQTLQVKPDNAATSVGAIEIQNALVVTQPDAVAKGPAVVSATLFNNSTTDQTLDSVTVDGAGAAEVTPAKGEGKGGKVVVPAGGSVILGGEGNASAVLSDLGPSVQNGNAQKVTFSFSKTGDVSLRAFVVPAEHYFEKWGPSDIPEAPVTSPSPSDKASGSPSASGSPEEGATEEEGAAAGSSGSPSASESEAASSH